MYMTALAMAVALPAIVVPVSYQAEASTVQFKDIPKTSPYYTAVTEMVADGIIMGYNDGTYKPQTEITRVQVAMLLARALPLEPVRDAKQFKDVPKTYKHYDAIRKVQQAGIIDGGSNGKFNPEAKLTRAEMAKILAVGFGLEVKADYDFPDVPTSHWANKHVRALYSNGITVGNNGKYEPNESVTRGQYAFFMHRLLNLDPNFEAKPIPKPEQPKPEQPKPEQPKPETPSVDTGLITDKYPNLNDVPKPPAYVAGKTEETNMNELNKQFEKLQLSEKGQYNMGVPENMMKRTIKSISTITGMSETDTIKVINNSITTGKLQVGSNYAMYYDYQKGLLVVGLKSK